jgi:uncharacterized protein YbaA (DUF1428 family)
MTQTLNTFKEQPPTEEQQAHDKAMLDKVAQSEQAGQERPEWLPEKFKSVEDMAKAYSELEKKMSNPASEKTDTEEKTNDTPDPETASATEVADVLDKAGVDFNSLQNEYSEEGKLSEQAYEKLEKAGFPKSLVDSWIAGQQAMANDMQSQVFGSVGGEENYNQMVEWAADNLPQADIDSFNKAVDSGDINMINFAVNGLAARYRSEVGTEPRLIQGETSGTSGGSFQSAAELTAAMRDPRYQKDPAYRKSVADKLQRSNVF